MQTDEKTSPLAHLYNLDNLVGDPSKKTLDTIAHEFALELASETTGLSYEEARIRAEKTIYAMVDEKRLKDLAALALGNPQVKLNRHQRRKQAKLERKHSTRNKL